MFRGFLLSKKTTILIFFYPAFNSLFILKILGIPSVLVGITNSYS